MAVNFRIHRDKLQAMLARAVTVVPSSASSPAAENFFLQLNGNSLTVSATDESVSYVLSSTAVESDDPPVSFQVPAKKFSDLVKRAYLGPIDFTLEDAQLKIVSMHAWWDLHIFSGAAFPNIPLTQERLEEVSRIDLLEAIAVVSRAVSKEATRAYLRMINVADRKVTACDGVVFQQVPFQSSHDFNIPQLAIPHLTRLLTSVTDENIKVSSAKLATTFQTMDGTVSLVSKNMAARFPAVEQMMLRPALENKSVMMVSRQELLRSVERVRLTADADTSAVGMKLDGDCVTVTAKDRNFNASSDTIPAVWKGKSRTLVISSIRLMDMLKSFKEDTVSFHLGEDTRARKSLVMIKVESGAVGVLPQMSANVRLF